MLAVVKDTNLIYLYSMYYILYMYLLFVFSIILGISSV